MNEPCILDNNIATWIQESRAIAKWRLSIDPDRLESCKVKTTDKKSLMNVYEAFKSSSKL